MAVFMSVKMMTAVFGIDVDSGRKLLLLALADCANDESHCWPSVPHLAWKTNLTDRHIRRMMKSLRDEGVLIPVSREGGGRQRSVIYQMDLGPLPKKQPLKGKVLSPIDEIRKKKAMSA